MIAPAHKGKLAKAENNDYSSQFGVALMNKDFHLILDVAKSANLDLPATAASYEVNSLAFKEDPTADFSCVIRQMEKSANSPASNAVGFAGSRTNSCAPVHLGRENG